MAPQELGIERQRLGALPMVARFAVRRDRRSEEWSAAVKVVQPCVDAPEDDLGICDGVLLEPPVARVTLALCELEAPHRVSLCGIVITRHNRCLGSVHQHVDQDIGPYLNARVDEFERTVQIHRRVCVARCLAVHRAHQAPHRCQRFRVFAEAILDSWGGGFEQLRDRGLPPKFFRGCGEEQVLGQELIDVVHAFGAAFGELSLQFLSLPGLVGLHAERNAEDRARKDSCCGDATRDHANAVATHELGDPVHATLWTCFDGFIGEVASQVIGEGGGGGVSARGVARDRLHGDPVEFASQGRGIEHDVERIARLAQPRAWRGGVGCLDRRTDAARIARLREQFIEGRCPTEHLVKHHTDGVDIAPSIDVVRALGLLGAHVQRCADHRARIGERGDSCIEPGIVAQCLGDAVVDDLADG